VKLLCQAIKQGYAYSNLHPMEDFESKAEDPPYIQLRKPKGYIRGFSAIFNLRESPSS